ncbi:MAG TPA: glycine oxidase ThiO [Terriglobales bacterium]|nr:glycine oxidase ThiO [Terriglobales bacterium]
MKDYDAIIVGAGIIGLSLAIALRKRSLGVLLLEKGEPGREASWAAGGMLADCGLEIPLPLRELATASARMYPEFVHELQDESGLKIDLRAEGTLLFLDDACGQALKSAEEIAALEPQLAANGRKALFLPERCVDPRDLTLAAVAAARHWSVDFSSGDQVLSVEIVDGKACGVRTNKTRFVAGTVINCAGAWAGQIEPYHFPTRPVKGQMLCVAMPQNEFLRHVVRTPDVYLIPRSDGRLLIGATQEETGFDKQAVPEALQKLRRAALDLCPRLTEARTLEAWAGLRPGTPDNLPILGETATPGYFVATGHFRDGILLAPVTAKVMAELVAGGSPSFDLSPFSSLRFHDSSAQLELL